MPSRMMVKDLMSTDLVTLTEDETLADAQRCMARGRIRHLPVVDEGRLVIAIGERGEGEYRRYHYVPDQHRLRRRYLRLRRLPE